MFGRGFGGAAPWHAPQAVPLSPARLGAVKLVELGDLGERARNKKLGQLACCTAPNGKGYCFDSGTGVCVLTWIAASGSPQPNSPG